MARTSRYGSRLTFLLVACSLPTACRTSEASNSTKGDRSLAPMSADHAEERWPAERFEAGLTRAPPAMLLGPQAVWANGSQMFHPLAGPMASANMTSLRVSYELSQDSGDCKLRPAVRFSGDGVTWGSVKELDSTWLIQDAVRYGEDFVDLLSLTSTPPKSWLQLGVQVANESGGALTVCNATLRVESKRL